MRGLLISNPIASRVTDARRRVVERALEASFELEVVHTEERGHAAEIARKGAEMGAKVVIAYGGDGTVNEVVNGLLATSDSTDVVLGLLPGGGTNVLARTLGYPRELVEATGHLLDLIERGSIRRLNLARLQAGDISRVFTFGAGLGLDAETVRRVEESGWRNRLGDAAFVYHGLRSFFSIRKGDEPPLIVETPAGGVDAWWAIVCKSDPLTYLRRRPIRVSPRARHEGGLDVTAGRTVGVLRTLRWLGQALTTGRQIRHPDCLYLTDLSLCAIRARRPVALQADGEFLGAVESLEARLLPQALAVYTS